MSSSNISPSWTSNFPSSSLCWDQEARLEQLPSIRIRHPFPFPLDDLDARQPSPGLQVQLRKLPTWCPSIGMRLVGSVQCPCAFSAGVPAGRGGDRWLVFLQGGAGAPRCPCARTAGSAPQAPAGTETGREAVTPGAVSHPGAAATRPTPSLRGRCLSSSLLPALSLSLFFSPGFGNPGGRRPGESQLTRSLPSKSGAPPGGNWVAAPSRLRWLSPPTLQPGLDGESIPIYGHVALWSNVPSYSMLVMSHGAQKSMLADSQPIKSVCMGPQWKT
ncbi:interleukin-15 isoform X1 [Symphalangus syndactylus]|uniref:interleukin-15 isoform X1 n=1 Tax=Symphalangus syndactylus TaxID=9590 RepID=UPI0030069FB1